ncbi:hypothetical protein ACJMK2_005287 [Sinanodonta woodiana]|uniref:Interleukin-6 n=1 Tax=Sinanodonta woodiana TaxID=1069815 RepID=A0ABD3VQ97_SINWO
MCLLILGLSASQSKAKSIENTDICRHWDAHQTGENPLGKPLFHLVQSLTLAKYYVTDIKEIFMSSRIQSSHCPVVECAKNALNFIIDDTVSTKSMKEDMATLLAIRKVISEMSTSEADTFYIERLNNLKIAVNNALSSLHRALLLYAVQPTESILHPSLCSPESLEERYFRDYIILKKIEFLVSRSERKYLRCRSNLNQANVDVLE